MTQGMGFTDTSSSSGLDITWDLTDPKFLTVAALAAFTLYRLIAASSKGARGVRRVAKATKRAVRAELSSRGK